MHRTRGLGSFPNGHATLMLMRASPRDMAEQKWGTQRYLNMRIEVYPHQGSCNVISEKCRFQGWHRGLWAHL